MSEFGTYCLFNFDQSDELKVTGKRFPNKGFLRTISATSVPMNGFGFLADDTLFCWVQLQEIQEAGNATKKSSSAAMKGQGAKGAAANARNKQAAAASLAKKSTLKLNKRQSS